MILGFVSWNVLCGSAVRGAAASFVGLVGCSPFTHCSGNDVGTQRFQHKTGLPLATYFSASKIAWILDNVDNARELADQGHLAFGTPDTWMLWNLTGGIDGGVHATDVTNASRTLLMDLETLNWDAELCEAFGVPMSVLPEIRSSSEVYGTVASSGLRGHLSASCAAPTGAPYSGRFTGVGGRGQGSQRGSGTLWVSDYPKC